MTKNFEGEERSIAPQHTSAAAGLQRRTSVPPAQLKLSSINDFRLGSWNLQGGIRDGLAQGTIGKDLATRKISVACLQETHCRDGLLADIEGGQLISLEDSARTPPRQRYGLGFYVAKDFLGSYVGHKWISNRIAVLQLRFLSGGHRSHLTVTIINVYGPTAIRSATRAGRKERTAFYQLLQDTLTTYRKSSGIVFIAGDWNSKLGLRRITQNGQHEAFMGAFGKGTRNSNGDSMVTFLEQTRMFASNTNFQHAMRYRSTWSGTISKDGLSKHYLNQIDYILVEQRYRDCITDARAHNGCTFPSDHSLVVTKMRLSNICRSVSRNHTHPERLTTRVPQATATNPRTPHIGQSSDISALASDPKLQDCFRRRLQQTHASPERTVAEHIDHYTTNITNVARATLPPKTKRYGGKVNYVHDLEVQQLSKEQCKLRMQLLQCEAPLVISSAIRQQRNAILKKIRARVRRLRAESIYRLAVELEHTPELRRKHEILRTLKRQDLRRFQLETPDGMLTHAPDTIINLVTDHFRSFFNPPHSTPLDPWGDQYTTLDRPITTSEMLSAMSKLSNGRTVGPDGIPGELLKYGGRYTAHHLSTAVNNMFRSRTLIPALGAGLLVPLNKPKKARTLANVRPITLLNTIRKALSLVVLDRIYPAVDKYVHASQTGFRRKRSSAEVAWAYGWLQASAWRFKRVLHIMGIDMSKAFDTVNRTQLMTVLSTIIPTSECRIIRVLLATATLQVTVRGQVGPVFTTAIGTPQGDGLSPILFVIYLESALRAVRAADQGLYSPFDPQKWGHNLTELSYADDVDFISTSPDLLQKLLDHLQPQFEHRQLFVNKDKTERVTISPDSSPQYKKLGTRLNADEDVAQRINQADVIFRSLWKLWHSSHRTVSVPTRVRLYDVCVKAIMLYNIQGTPLTETRMRALEVAHRRHLRRILKIAWPMRISNTELYNRTNSCSIRHNIITTTILFLGRTLTQPTEFPAHAAMKKYFQDLDTAPPRRGAPKHLLPHHLHLLLSRSIGCRFNSLPSYNWLKYIARTATRDSWTDLTKTIVDRLHQRANDAERLRSERRFISARRKRRALEAANEDTAASWASVPAAPQPDSALTLSLPAYRTTERCVLFVQAGKIFRLSYGFPAVGPVRQPSNRMRRKTHNDPLNKCHVRKRRRTSPLPSSAPINLRATSPRTPSLGRSAAKRKAEDQAMLEARTGSTITRNVRRRAQVPTVDVFSSNF